MNVDARAKCTVDRGRQICCEKDDALKVFELAKEDCHRSAYDIPF